MLLFLNLQLRNNIFPLKIALDPIDENSCIHLLIQLFKTEIIFAFGGLLIGCTSICVR